MGRTSAVVASLVVAACAIGVLLHEPAIATPWRNAPEMTPRARSSAGAPPLNANNATGGSESSTSDGPASLRNATAFQFCGVNPDLLNRFQVSMDEQNRQRYIKLAGGFRCIRDAYVGFADDNRIELYAPVADAVGSLSSRPLLFFAVQAQKVPTWSLAPHVVVIRLGKLPLHIWFAKMVAISVAPSQHGVIIEADSVITQHCDSLFGIVSRFCGPHPLLALHPAQDRPSVVIPLEQRSTPFLHAHAVWTHRARLFAERILRHCSKETGTGFEDRLPAIDCTSDEDAMTTALWNAKYSSYLCVFDPFFLKPELDDWAAGRPLSQDQPSQAFFIVHGAKSMGDLASSLSLVKRATKAFPVWADGNYSQDANWCAKDLDPAWLCEEE